MTTRTSDALETVIARFARDRRMAHAVLFAHRHTDPSAPMHAEMIEAWHAAAPRVSIEAFRDAAKSTTGEEAVTLRGSLREFRNCLIVGSSEARAMERVEAIKHEVQTNEDLLEVFGHQQGGIWTGHKMELASGPLIQAVGIGQSLRGVKHHQWRPDFCWIDDIEDEESVRTPEARKERYDWLFGTLLPALAKDARVRMTGNRLDEDAVIAKVANDPTFRSLIFPIVYLDEAGKEAATWPAKFPMEWITKERAGYEHRGQSAIWEREYMCRAVSAESRKFKPEMLTNVVKPRLRTWEPTYAFIDPARTAHKTSATTGWVVFSWIGNRIVIWDAGAQLLMPDQVIDLAFRIDDEFQPVQIGVEEDGLNEFLMQPLRQEQLKRGRLIPVKAMRAPRSKLDFIAALQPFFAGGDVTFAKDLPELKQQLLNFPTGKIDAPNALAYAPRMRPGVPIYDTFGEANIVKGLRLVRNEGVWMAINAARGHVAAAMLQFAGGALRVLADWIEEGEPGQVVPRIIKAANIAAPGEVPSWCAPPLHFDTWNNLGLKQALRARQIDLRQGVDWKIGREELREYFRHDVRGAAGLQVSSRARWTLSALAGGYALAVGKRGEIAERAEENIYRTLMEGIESFAGLLRVIAGESEGREVHYATARDGSRYVCAMPGRR